MQKLSFALVASCLTLICSQVFAQESISAEGEAANPIVLPPAVLRLWSNEPDVRATLQGEQKRSVPADWYRAESLKLSATVSGIVVVGQAPLSGAHAGWFWVYTKNQRGWVLRAHLVADQIMLLPALHGGMRDIQTCYFTVPAIYCMTEAYDGHKYKVVRRTTELNNN